MTRFVERAVAREIVSSELALHVVDGDRQPPGEQVLAVPAHGLGATQLQRMGIAPLGWSRHDDRIVGKSRPLAP